MASQLARQNLNVVIICITLMAKNLEHFSNVYWPLVLHHLRTDSSFIDWVIRLFLVLFIFLYIFGTNPLSDVKLSKNLLTSLPPLYAVISFAVQRPSNFMESSPTIIFSEVLVSFSESLCLCLQLKMFSSNSFGVLGPTWKSLTHFKLIFVQEQRGL